MGAWEPLQHTQQRRVQRSDAEIPREGGCHEENRTHVEMKLLAYSSQPIQDDRQERDPTRDLLRPMTGLQSAHNAAVTPSVRSAR